MKRNSSPFKWRHYAPDVILLCVRWYCRYQLSYRDVEESNRGRGLVVDLSTVFRWVQKYAPEINKRIPPHLKMDGASYRPDETYIKVGQSCKGYENDSHNIRHGCFKAPRSADGSLLAAAPGLDLTGILRTGSHASSCMG